MNKIKIFIAFFFHLKDDSDWLMGTEENNRYTYYRLCVYK